MPYSINYPKCYDIQEPLYLQMLVYMWAVRRLFFFCFLDYLADCAGDHDEDRSSCFRGQCLFRIGFDRFGQCAECHSVHTP